MRRGGKVTLAVVIVVVCLYLGAVLVGSLGWDVHLTGARAKPDAAAGFGTRAASLRGTYGVQQGGESVPFLKVDEVKAGYQFSERVEGEWGIDPQGPHVASEDEVKSALGLDSVTGFPVFGLATDRAMLLKVPAGWTGPGGRFTTKTGFVLVSGRQLMEAKKVELGGR